MREPPGMDEAPTKEALEREVFALRARTAELEGILDRLAEAEEQVLGARAQAQALLDNIPHMAIGDHATNIAEDVIFMVSARDVRHHAGDRPQNPS